MRVACSQEAIEIYLELTQPSIAMQSAISIEQEIIDGVRASPISKQQEVLDFVDFLRQRVTFERSENRLTMREISKLPIHERHKLLEKYIPAVAEDFASDPTLTEFSEPERDD